MIENNFKEGQKNTFLVFINIYSILEIDIIIEKY